MVNCMDESLEGDQPNFTEHILSYEQLMIQEGFLQDASGASYHKAITALFTQSENTEFEMKLPSVNFMSYTNELFTRVARSDAQKCMIQYRDNPEYEDSRLARLDAASDAFRNMDNPKLVLDKLLELLPEEAFDEPYYKMSYFMLVETMSYLRDDGISRKLPAIDEDAEAPVYTAEQILVVYLNEEDELLVEGVKVELSALRAIVKRHIEAEKAAHIISLQNDRMTSYKAYIAVQNEIVAAYREVRENYAQQTYGKSLEELTEEELNEVKMIYPQKLSEAEPRD